MATPTTNYNLLKPGVGETYNVQLLDDNYDKIDAALTVEDKKALGLLQKKRVPSSGAAPNTTLIVVENFATQTFTAGRHYRISWQLTNYTGASAGTFIAISIQSAATTDAAGLTTGLTSIESGTLECAVANTGQTGRLEAYYDPVSTGALQIKFLAQVVIGTTCALSNYVCTIEDLGAQY